MEYFKRITHIRVVLDINPAVVIKIEIWSI